ncbi:hypothetical protein ACVGVM_24445 [Pseudonocardia bannensis]|uniref:hypothetical protein n=1 Tax=Pseudonocardia bannensis TaxID=630973 RepID=UPI001FE24F97|nr:hypothetical protein [Pseudonocardia bannensis]
MLDTELAGVAVGGHDRNVLPRAVPPQPGEWEWLDFIAELVAEPLTDWPEERIAARLCGTFELPGCAFGEQSACGSIRARLWLRNERCAGHRAGIEAWGTPGVCQVRPIPCCYRPAGRGEPIQVAGDPGRGVDPRITATWNELARPWGCAGQLVLPLRFEAGRLRAFSLGRARPFSAAEIALADRVRLLLSGLERQVEAFGGARHRDAPGADGVNTPSSACWPRA